MSYLVSLHAFTLCQLQASIPRLYFVCVTNDALLLKFVVGYPTLTLDSHSLRAWIIPGLGHLYQILAVKLFYGLQSL